MADFISDFRAPPAPQFNAPNINRVPLSSAPQQIDLPSPIDFVSGFFDSVKTGLGATIERVETRRQSIIARDAQIAEYYQKKSEADAKFTNDANRFAFEWNIIQQKAAEQDQLRYAQLALTNSQMALTNIETALKRDTNYSAHPEMFQAAIHEIYQAALENNPQLSDFGRDKFEVDYYAYASEMYQRIAPASAAKAQEASVEVFNDSWNNFAEANYNSPTYGNDVLRAADTGVDVGAIPVAGKQTWINNQLMAGEERRVTTELVDVAARDGIAVAELALAAQKDGKFVYMPWMELPERTALLADIKAQSVIRKDEIDRIEAENQLAMHISLQSLFAKGELTSEINDAALNGELMDGVNLDPSIHEFYRKALEEKPQYSADQMKSMHLTALTLGNELALGVYADTSAVLTGLNRVTTAFANDTITWADAQKLASQVQSEMSGIYEERISSITGLVMDLAKGEKKLENMSEAWVKQQVKSILFADGLTDSPLSNGEIAAMMETRLANKYKGFQTDRSEFFTDGKMITRWGSKGGIFEEANDAYAMMRKLLIYDPAIGKSVNRMTGQRRDFDFTVFATGDPSFGATEGVRSFSQLQQLRFGDRGKIKLEELVYLVNSGGMLLPEYVETLTRPLPYLAEDVENNAKLEGRQQSLYNLYKSVSALAFGSWAKENGMEVQIAENGTPMDSIDASTQIVTFYAKPNSASHNAPYEEYIVDVQKEELTVQRRTEWEAGRGFALQDAGRRVASRVDGAAVVAPQGWPQYFYEGTYHSLSSADQWFFVNTPEGEKAPADVYTQVAINPPGDLKPIFVLTGVEGKWYLNDEGQRRITFRRTSE
jgi:hypothetical protein